MSAGLTNGATQENRRLSIDLAGLIIYWEQKAIEAGATAVQVGPSVVSYCL
jgi:preprotein translocase subunit Sec61beta